MKIKTLILLGFISAFALCGTKSSAEESEDIAIGMSAAFSGPAKELGINMRKGVLAYFNQVNAQGGINGQKLKLFSIDDSYEPEFAASNVYNLINKNGVTSFIGNVGTPTAKAATPITIENEVLYYAPFSGSSILRPYDNKEFLIKTKSSREFHTNKYIINYRASYAQETEKIIENLLHSGIKPYEIAIFTQDDSYGFDGYIGAIDALEKRGYLNSKEIPYGTYQRNSLDIEDGLLEILSTKREIRAVVIVGSYKPAAKFIKFASKLIPNAVFINVSFVGCLPLAGLLNDTTDEVFVTQVVPHFNSDLPLVKEYKQDLKKYFPKSKPNFVSLEGYISAYLFVEGLKNSSGDYSSQGIIRGIEKIDFDNLNLGFDLSLDELDHQISDNVWLTKINKDTCEEVSWKDFRNHIEEMTKQQSH
ncbi:MAG: leucine/isoleucine/valine-binding protein precursor [Thermodesulfobacteriota bacterium]|nr:MAG: leucine/isoleucine/valine-binding protein precursor [Thermodesulfobacteriota bacterium]